MTEHEVYTLKKQTIMEFISWSNEIAKTDPMTLENDHDDLADMFLLGILTHRQKFYTESMPQSKPSLLLLDSMCMRYRHDFGLLEEKEKEAIRVTMTQVWEEVVGLGFYKYKQSFAEISDEEIEQAVRKNVTSGGGSMGWIKDAFRNGAKWYREQIKYK